MMKLNAWYGIAALFIFFKGLADFCAYKIAIGIPETVAGVLMLYAITEYQRLVDSSGTQDLLVKEQKKLIEELKDSNALKAKIIEEYEQLKKP